MADAPAVGPARSRRPLGGAGGRRRGGAAGLAPVGVRPRRGGARAARRIRDARAPAGRRGRVRRRLPLGGYVRGQLRAVPSAAHDAPGARRVLGGRVRAVGWYARPVARPDAARAIRRLRHDVDAAARRRRHRGGARRGVAGVAPARPPHARAGPAAARIRAARGGAAPLPVQRAARPVLRAGHAPADRGGRAGRARRRGAIESGESSPLRPVRPGPARAERAAPCSTRRCRRGGR